MTWRASTRIENSNKIQKISPPISSDIVLDFLRTACAPTTILELVQHMLQSGGLDRSQHGIYVAKRRAQRALEHLRDTGVAISVPVPGWRKHLWTLRTRESEFWPKGRPHAAGNYTDTEKVMETLQRAPGLISVNEIVDQIAIAMGERPRSKRVHHLGCRVRGCLHFHREQGSVFQILYAGTQKQLWLLASRKDELLPDSISRADGTILNDASVLSIIRASKKPSTAPEIARAVIANKGEIPTDRAINLALMRVREHLRQFRAEGLVRKIRTKGRRFGAWVLADATE